MRCASASASALFVFSFGRLQAGNLLAMPRDDDLLTAGGTLNQLREAVFGFKDSNRGHACAPNETTKIVWLAGL
jgi:hypothetical protein